MNGDVKKNQSGRPRQLSNTITNLYQYTYQKNRSIIFFYILVLCDTNIIKHFEGDFKEDCYKYKYV